MFYNLYTKNGNEKFTNYVRFCYLIGCFVKMTEIDLLGNSQKK